MTLKYFIQTINTTYSNYESYDLNFIKFRGMFDITLQIDGGMDE